jgi:hypothetical protein
VTVEPDPLRERTMHMQKWEFQFVAVSNDEMTNTLKFGDQRLTNTFKKIGEEGWELVAVTNHNTDTLFAFKRPLEEKD